MNSNKPAIKTVKESILNHEVQIIYTQIDTTDSGVVTFKDYSYQLNSNRYFYPASTVKLPVAILAAEYTDGTNELSLDIPYITSRDTEKHSVADDISAIFAVSDNESFNRLYEILGRDYINDQLMAKGLNPTRIAHRLSTADAEKSERATIKFFPGYSAETIVLDNARDQPVVPIKNEGIKKGQGVIENERLVKKPMDFSKKNYFPLEAQHNLVKRLIFPENFSKNERFHLSDETRERILNLMKTLPKDAGYTGKEYYDSYVKFFLYGDQKESIPDHITIYNKVGYAYGTLTETAYVVDTKEQIRYLLSATILVNKNGIFNDDTYEYESVGIPFLAELGREIHKLELERR